MKLALSITFSLLAASYCREASSQRPTPEVVLPDVACGAVVEVPHGNSPLLMMNESVWSKLTRWWQLPQIVDWKPSLWKPGTTLRVNFLDGEISVHSLVMDVAREWLPGLKLNFAESSDAQAEVRITFTGYGAWSKVGKLANSVAAGQPTMGLGALLQTQDASVKRAYILHEFGHALGAVHEHQRPEAPLTWNRDVVNAYYWKEYGWPATQVDQQVILPFTSKDVIASSQFDRMSVMMYPVLKEFTKEQFVQPWNSQLTDWDRSVMKQAYK